MDTQIRKHFDRICDDAAIFHCEDTILFYNDILCWETDRSKVDFFRMGECYVRPGGMYEHGVISDEIRRQWLDEGDDKVVSVVKQMLYSELRLNPLFVSLLAPYQRFARRFSPPVLMSLLSA